MVANALLLDALLAGDAAKALRSLDDGGELTRLIPELEAGRGFAQPEMHYFDVFGHNLATVAALGTALDDMRAPGGELRQALDWLDIDDAIERSVNGIPLLGLLRLACLVHDVAKPATAVHENGRLRFPRHGPRGSEMMRERLPALGFSPEATTFVATMVRYHLRPPELIRNWPPSDRAVRKFVDDLDGHVLPLMLVNLSDGMATRGPRYTREHYRRHCGLVSFVTARALAVTDEDDEPLLTGDDLMAELDLTGGRLLGAVLTSVHRAQVAGSVSDREEALALARSVLATLRANKDSTPGQDRRRP